MLAPTRTRLIALAAVAAMLAATALVLTHGNGSSAHAGTVTKLPPPASRGKTIHKSGYYYTAARKSDPKAPRSANGAPRARAADVRAAFSVLARPQTAEERGDFDIQQLVKDRPNAQLDGARALNAAHTVWIIPTDDGQLCIGMKLSGGPTFTSACGPAATALSNGLAMTHGDGKLALLPDAARAGQYTAKGAKTAVTENVGSNYLWLPDGGALTFTDASGTHTL
jgi:hypothetical protein